MASHQEDNIKETLQKMPDIVPSSKKEELYQRISTQQNNQPKKKSRRLVLIPAFSTIFIALLVIVLVVDRGHNSVQNEKVADQASHEYSTFQQSTSKDQGNQLRSTDENIDSSLVIQEINDQETIVHGEVTDEKSEYVIPVSYVLPSELTNEFYDDQIKMVKHTLSKMFPSSHFRNEVFKDEQKVNGEPIEKAGYKIYTNTNSNKKFLIPITLKENTDFKGALLEMQNVEAESYVIPSIPGNVSFSINEKENIIHLTLRNDISLEDNKQYKNMLEAILMTAKSYGYNAVKFNNTNKEQIGPYNLTDPIQVPIAVNPIKSFR
ncbi:hypothetical protein LG329_01810 [Virgibacillus necropolis]|uniref:hypothetical protein n=1 Tax=Virgibacillus necropolis TaxID=163877 RepID=UPI00384B21E0